MLLRTAGVIVAGALLAGCQQSGVQGDMSYGSVQGDADHRGAVIDTSTPTVVRATPDGDAGRSVTRVTPDNNGGGTVVRTTTDRDTSRGTVARVTTDRDKARTASERVNSSVIPPGKADPERAAFANTAKYPKDIKATDDARLTALIARSDRTLRIANASDQPLRNVRVWANGTYVALVPEVPAYGTAMLRPTDFSDKNGAAPADMNFSTVQVQEGDHLYNAQGPVSE